MFPRALAMLGVATIVVSAFTGHLAKSAQERMLLGTLNANEGIYVDVKGFGVIKGAAKSDPSAQLVKLGAQEVRRGAIIIRAGDKLYLVDSDPMIRSKYSDWAEEAFKGVEEINRAPLR